MGRLDGKVVIITGAARGQGAAAARRFVAEGARVVLGDILDEQGKQVAAELGEAAEYVHLDVREEHDWAAAVEVATSRFGRLDGLVNNAGIVRIATLADTTAEDFMEVTAVNQLGVLLGMRAAAGAMRKAGGTIVNTSSIEGLVGTPMLTAYCASKFAVVGMTKAAAVELGAERIRVNAVCPGVIRTEMTAALPARVEASLTEKTPLGRLGDPAEIVALLVFLTSDESSFCTGASFVADGGMTAGI